MDFEKFIAELTDVESVLTNREQELKTELAAVQQNLRKVRDARVCIVGKKRGNGSRKAAPTKQDVHEAISSVLGEHAAASESELRELVESRLAGLGKSKQGFALRFKEALQSKSFVQSASGWQLKSNVDGQPGQHGEHSS